MANYETVRSSTAEASRLDLLAVGRVGSRAIIAVGTANPESTEGHERPVLRAAPEPNDEQLVIATNGSYLRGLLRHMWGSSHSHERARAFRNWVQGDAPIEGSDYTLHGWINWERSEATDSSIVVGGVTAVGTMGGSVRHMVSSRVRLTPRDEGVGYVIHGGNPTAEQHRDLGDTVETATDRLWSLLGSEVGQLVVAGFGRDGQLEISSTTRGAQPLAV